MSADDRYDTSHVTVDIGLDVHVDVPLAEGIELSAKRAEVLRKCVCPWRTAGRGGADGQEEKGI
jgi:hypothetical protein